MAARHSAYSRTLNTLILYWACCVWKKKEKKKKKGAGEETNKLSRPSLFCHARFRDKGWKRGWEAGFIMSGHYKSPFSLQTWHVRSCSLHIMTQIIGSLMGGLALSVQPRNAILRTGEHGINLCLLGRAVKKKTQKKTTRDASKGHLIHIAVSLSPSLSNPYWSPETHIRRLLHMPLPHLLSLPHTHHPQNHYLSTSTVGLWTNPE